MVGGPNFWMTCAMCRSAFIWCHHGGPLRDRPSMNESRSPGDTGLGDGVVNQVLVGSVELVGQGPGVGELEQGGAQPWVPVGVEACSARRPWASSCRVPS